MTIKHALNRWRYMNRNAEMHLRELFKNLLEIAHVFKLRKEALTDDGILRELVHNAIDGVRSFATNSNIFESIYDSYNSFKWYHNKAKELADEYGFTDKDMDGMTL